ncbi:MAG: hypothetical protein HPY57_15095 [Ignavibacteria bacterium]|nr:hypothetical protein [Ignavibacteria bacterium]
MKIRNGFVSNSSSSSFIVVWDKKPTSVEEVHQILFNGEKLHTYWDDSYDAKELAQIIFNDTKQLSKDEIIKIQRELYQYNSWSDKNYWYSKGYKPNKELCRKYEEEMKIASDQEKYWEDVLKKFSDKEKQTFLRKNKLERVLNEKTENERERLYFEAVEKLREVRKALWESNETMDKLVEESAEKFINDFGDKFISYYHYSDNNGDIQAYLEHSGVFDKLKHWQISHH